MITKPHSEDSCFSYFCEYHLPNRQCHVITASGGWALLTEEMATVLSGKFACNRLQICNTVVIVAVVVRPNFL